MNELNENETGTMLDTVSKAAAKITTPASFAALVIILFCAVLLISTDIGQARPWLMGLIPIAGLCMLPILAASHRQKTNAGQHTSDAAAYRGPIIEGEWLCFPGEPSDANPASDGTATIKQVGSRVTMMLKFVRPNKPVRNFLYIGIIDHSNVLLTWHQEAAEGHNCGAVVLRLSGDTNTLAGMTVYFRHAQSHVVAEGFFLQRA